MSSGFNIKAGNSSLVIKIGIIIDSNETAAYNWAKYLNETLKREHGNSFPDFNNIPLKESPSSTG